MHRGAPEGGGLDRPLGVGGDEETTIHRTERCRSRFTRRTDWRLARALVARTRATPPATDRCPRSPRTRFAGSSSAFRSATAICGTKVITTNPVAWKVHQDEGARWIRSELIGMVFASIPRRRLGSQRPVTAPGFTAMIEERCQQGQRQTGGVQVFPACSSRVGFMTATAWSIMARMSAASSSGSRSAIQMRRLRPSPSARTWTDAL